MRIVDAHMHLGEDLMFCSDDSEETLLAVMEAHGIAVQIVQPGIVSRDQPKAHERIYRFAQANPGRIYGVACFNPYIDDDEYRRLLCWTVRNLHFRGVKIHPNAFCLTPNHPEIRKILDCAAELGIAVMIHTGNGFPNSLPSLWMPLAKEYPDLKIVLAHAGGGTFGSDAIVAAQECPNIYLETSWTTVHDLAAMIQKIGPDRVMFGTDTILNVPVELAKYRALDLPESSLEWCLGKTAAKVFRMEDS